ncbi:hypothetical protein MSG28_003036 [Choristoneura fumiferana]|uniref:Uncharacterized protein n=1 Tax=Choristoneura fumiferana TaxID=7141 RepID=A0ACC0JKP0_CHOFU|nr:hypothetical protein MSG28_003036 [Choristoneura fumiferana]
MLSTSYFKIFGPISSAYDADCKASFLAHTVKFLSLFFPKSVTAKATRTLRWPLQRSWRRQFSAILRGEVGRGARDGSAGDAGQSEGARDPGSNSGGESGGGEGAPGGSNCQSFAGDVEDPVGEGWKEVHAKKKQRRLTSVRCTGGANVTSLRAVEARKHIHLWNMVSGAEEVQEYLQELCERGACTVEELKSRGEYKQSVLAHESDILVAVESWLSVSVEDSELVGETWSVLRRDRATGRQGGGVLVAARPAGPRSRKASESSLAGRRPRRRRDTDDAHAHQPALKYNFT